MPYIFTSSVDEVNELLMPIEKGPIAFDLEWVTHDKVVTLCVMSMQILDFVLNIDLRKMGRKLPSEIQRILASPKILKTGVGVHNDMRELHNHYRIDILLVAEVGLMPLIIDPLRYQERAYVEIGLASMVKDRLGFILPKEEQNSNWAAEKLTEKQLAYAAADVEATALLFRTFAQDLVIASATDELAQRRPCFYTYHWVKGQAKNLYLSCRGEFTPWQRCPWWQCGQFQSAF
ncbi:ribonuclease H-like domain-containing protein [Mycena epipterygia]|nr:ribonuclease H-like domain-containing protein [Mycena epipterygia]